MTEEAELEADRCLWGVLAFVGNIHFNPDYAALKRELLPPRSLDTWGHYYEIGSLGRACRASCTTTLSGVDWFALTAEELLKLQEKEGRWPTKNAENCVVHDVSNTCFAMLFLKKFAPVVLSEQRRGVNAPPRKPD